jgi:hypothetical protein
MTSIESSAISATAPSSGFDVFMTRVLGIEAIRTRLHLLKLEYIETALRAGWIDGDCAVAMLGEPSS